MKTIFNASAAILLIALLSVSTETYAKKHPGQAQSQNNKGITYVVMITDPIKADLCHTYEVVIKDAYGNPVGLSIMYSEGISTYIFHESDNVSGTRIASLEQMGGHSGMICHQVLSADQDFITGEFRSGSVYIFNLTPTLKQLYINN